MTTLKEEKWFISQFIEGFLLHRHRHLRDKCIYGSIDMYELKWAVDWGFNFISVSHSSLLDIKNDEIEMSYKTFIVVNSIAATIK